MKQFWLQVAGLMIVVVLGFFFYMNQQLVNNFSLPFNLADPFSTNSQPQNSDKQILIVDEAGNTKTIVRIELAETPDKRAKGLGGRTSLASDSGMLFVFNKPSKYQFWMKEMKIPLDFIWIKGDQVVDILANVPPPQPNQSDQTLPIYAPVTDVDRVLEVNSGFVASNSIKVGDKLKLVEN